MNMLIDTLLNRQTAKAVRRKREQNIASLFFCLFKFLENTFVLKKKQVMRAKQEA